MLPDCDYITSLCGFLFLGFCLCIVTISCLPIRKLSDVYQLENSMKWNNNICQQPLRLLCVPSFGMEYYLTVNLTLHI